jgi:Protein of Unknown function (DUF2784).
MLFRIAADIVLLGHLSFILFVMFGGFFTFRWRKTALIHLPAVIWGVYVEITGNNCPLTYLENDLRRAAGQAGYHDSFIEHYLLPLIYPPGLTTNIQLLLAAIVFVTNTAIYARLTFKHHRKRQV